MHAALKKLVVQSKKIIGGTTRRERGFRKNRMPFLKKISEYILTSNMVFWPARPLLQLLSFVWYGSRILD